NEAERIAPGEPLALLLNAQVAQLSGDRAAAEHAFGAMTERDDTKLLGLRGLYIEAQRRKDVVAARAYAEEAATASPALGWAGQGTLEFRCASGDWSAALSALDRNSRYGLIDKAEYKRQRAVLLTAQALAAAGSDRDRARAPALASAHSRSMRSSSRRPWCQPPSWPDGCWAMPANCAVPAGSSRKPGRPIRIRIWRTPTRTFAPAIRRGSG